MPDENDIENEMGAREEEAFRRGYWCAINDVIEGFSRGLISRQLQQYFYGDLWDWRYGNLNRAVPPPDMPESWSVISKRILKRDNYLCHYCGKKADTTDHIIPVSRGGTDDETNLVAACKSCNSKKHTKSYNEFLRIW